MTPSKPSLARSAAAAWPPLAGMVLVGGFFVVLHDRWSMWLDEAFSSAIVRQSAPDLARQLWNQEANHAPYYVLLWGWSRLSDTVWFERSLSLVGTFVAIWGVWLLAKRWGGRTCAAVSVAVFCTLSFTLSWSLQARGYTWLMAVMVWTMIALDLRADRRSRWWAVAAGAGIGMATAISLASACFIAPVLLTFLGIDRSRRAVADVLVIVACAVLAFSPFAWAFAVNRGQIGWIPPLSVTNVTKAFHLATGTDASLGILTAGLVGCTIGVVAGRATPRALSVVMGALGGVVLLALVSAVVQPMFIGRYLAPAVPMAAVACGVAIAAVPVRWRRVATVSSIALVVGILALSLESVQPNAIEDWRAAAELIGDRSGDGDLVVVAPRYAGVALVRYWPPGIDRDRQAFVAGGDGTRVGLTDAEGRPADAQHVWFVVRGTPRRLLGTDRAFLRSVHRRWETVRVIHLDGVSVLRLDGSRNRSRAP